MTRYNNRRMTLLLCHGRLHPRRLNSFVEYYSKYLESSRAWDDATYLDIDSGCLPDILQNLLIRNRRQLKQFELILDLCPGSVRYTDKTASLNRRYYENVYGLLTPGGHHIMPVGDKDRSFLSFYNVSLPKKWLEFFNRFEWVKCLLKYLVKVKKVEWFNMLAPHVVFSLRLYKNMAESIDSSSPGFGVEKRQEFKRMLKTAIKHQAAYKFVGAWLELDQNQLPEQEVEHMENIFTVKVLNKLTTLFKSRAEVSLIPETWKNPPFIRIIKNRSTMSVSMPPPK